MKKKIKLFGICSLACASTLAVGGMTLASAEDATGKVSSAQTTVITDAKWTIEGLDNVPEYGTEMDMPSATAEIDGVKTAAETYVVYPNGSAYNGESFTVSSAGKYTVVFYAEKDGKFAKTERTFTVNAPYVSHGSSSSCVYGEYTKFSSTKNNEGYLLRIAEGDTIEFNRLIDVKAAKNNALVDLFICPDGESADFEKLTLTFTDASNPDTYFTVTVNRVDSGAWVGSNSCQYVKAAGNGQSLTGIEGYGTTSEKVHVDNDYGTCISVPFDARNNDANKTMFVPSDYSLRLSFDAEENVLKANGNFVTDFDDPDYYSSLWSGFSSGKAKLSISASGYNSKTANICIREIFGFDFSETVVVDTTPPEIEVNTDYETMPKAQIGISYSVPSAVANDDYLGACDVYTKVIYGKGTAYEYTVPYENGCFTPNAAGEYTIVYSASDGYGNLAEKQLKVTAVRKADELQIQVPEYAEYNYGEYLELLPADVIGGSGNVTTKIRVFAGEDEIKVTGNKVKLDRVAEWTVEYSAEDYLGRTKSVVVAIVTKISEDPILAQEPVLPVVMIEGSTYTIEKLYAERYSVGSNVASEILCDVTITDKDGAHVIKSGEKYVPSVAESGDTVTVCFSADGTAFETTYEIPVVKAKGEDEDGYATVDMAQYFCGEDIEAVATNSGVTIKAKKEGNVGWTFANALLSETFSIEIARDEAKAWFSGIRIVLTDVYDKSNVAVAELKIKRGGSVLKSGKNEVLVSEDVYSSDAVTISYKDGFFKIGNVSVAAEKSTGGAFDGFVQRKAFLEVVALNVEENAEYEVRTISLHRFNNETEDYTAPSIHIDGKYGGSFDLGSVYTLPAAYAGDVLAPNTSITLTVTSPTGKVVKDVNGNALSGVAAEKEYQIRLDEYGQYKIKYKVKEEDWFDLDRTMQYLITVDDGNAPTIIVGETADKMKVGDVFALPTISVSDDCTAEENIAVGVYVYNPQGKMIKLSGKYFKFDLVGTYEFRVIAIDEAGNTAVKAFKVTVGEQ